MKKINERVIELMKENGMNTNDEVLVANIAIIYLEAQKDELERNK